MTSSADRAAKRRRFLQFLAASPLLACSTFTSDAVAEDGLQLFERLPDPLTWAPFGSNKAIANPKDALDVFDFERVAYQKVPPAHFGYMASGVDDDFTLRANRADFGKLAVRPRRLRNVANPDSSIELFGMKWDSPVFLCPAGGLGAFHGDAEIAVSKAAEKGKHLQFLSSAASRSIEDTIAARGGTQIGFQLYAPTDFEIAKSMILRAERAGSRVMAITVDSVGRRMVTSERMKQLDTRNCLECHQTMAGGTNRLEWPSLSHLDLETRKRYAMAAGGLDWEMVRRLRDTTKMKVLIKGIVDPADAALCVKYGFDGVYLSNHGGRSGDIGTSTISILPEVVAAVKGKVPVIVDSGFRRGMDVVKAMALGASAVGVGRPYIWGLGAFGEEGVARVLELLRAEVKAAQAQAGAPRLKDLLPEMIRKV